MAHILAQRYANVTPATRFVFDGISGRVRDAERRPVSSGPTNHQRRQVVRVGAHALTAPGPRWSLQQIAGRQVGRPGRGGRQTFAGDSSPRRAVFRNYLVGPAVIAAFREATEKR